MSNKDNKRISFIDIIKTSFSLFRRKYYEVLILVSLPFLAFTLLYIYSGDYTLEAISNIPAQIVYAIYTILLISYLVIFPTTIYMIKDELSEKASSLSVQLKRSIAIIPRLLLGFILIAALGFILVLTFILILSILGNSELLLSFTMIVLSFISIKLFISFLFFQHSVIFENLKTLQAFKHSIETAKKSWWRIFVFYLITELLLFFILNLFSMIFAYIVPNTIVFNIIIAFLQALSVIFTQIFTSVMYKSIQTLSD